MFLERTNIRIEIMIVLSIALHILLISWMAKQKGKLVEKRQLTEVEFIEDIEPPSQMEKLMKKLVTSPSIDKNVVLAKAAVRQLEQVSFSKVVGLDTSLDEDAPIDMTKLAQLPEPDFDKELEKLPELDKPSKKIALKSSGKKKQLSLESKVVALAELPPADFDLGIQHQQFQQPEQVIKQVKAERRRATVGGSKKLSLSKSTFIQGEVKGRDILRRGKPKIPRWLEEKGIEAEVIIRFAVDPDGEVNERMIIEKTSGYAELDRLAIDALKKFIFAPLPLTVKQVEEKGIITFRFSFYN